MTLALTLLSLPYEVHCSIYSFLPLKSCLNLSETCHKYRCIFEEIKRKNIGKEDLFAKRFKILKATIGLDLGLIPQEKNLCSLSLYECQKIHLLAFKHLPSSRSIPPKILYESYEKILLSKDGKLFDILFSQLPTDQLATFDLVLILLRASQINHIGALKRLTSSHDLSRIDGTDVALCIKEGCKKGHLDCVKLLLQMPQVSSICALEWGLSFIASCEYNHQEVSEFLYHLPFVHQLSDRIFEEAFIKSFSCQSLETAVWILQSPLLSRLSTRCLEQGFLKCALHLDSRGVEAFYKHSRFSKLSLRIKIPSLSIFILTRAVEGLCINKSFS